MLTAEEAAELRRRIARDYAGLSLEDALARATAAGYRPHVLALGTPVRLSFQPERLRLYVDEGGNLVSVTLG